MRIYLHSVFLEPENLLPLAQRAEQFGYHGITVSDHLIYPKDLGSQYPYGVEPFPSTSPWPDLWVTVGALAGATKKLRFLSCAYLALARPPAIVAKSVGTAAIMSDYRVDFGMSVGWMREEFDHTGQDFGTRGRRCEEMIELLRECWSGDWVEHHGNYWDFKPFRMCPAPAQPIPIYGGGDSEAAMRRAAKLDGWLGARWYAMEDAIALADRIQAYRREAETADRDDFEVFISLDRAPTVQDCHELEQHGVTAVWTHPWKPVGEADGDPGLETMLEAIEQYAIDVLPNVRQDLSK